MKSILAFVKTTILAFFVVAGFAGLSHAQSVRKPDIIVLKNNTKLEVVIQEVDENVIKYKKLTDLEGPLFSVKKSEIASVLYGNGDVATFPDTSSDVFFRQENNTRSVEPISPQPVPRNKFEEIIYAQNPNQLRQSYQFYRSKSKKGLVLGIVFTVLGTVSMGVGTGLITNSGYNNYSGYYIYDNNQAATGTALLIGGLVGGATFGTIGFVKAGKNGSKATRIKRELIRRRESVTFKFQPGYNAATQSGYLSLKMNF